MSAPAASNADSSAPAAASSSSSSSSINGGIVSNHAAIRAAMWSLPRLRVLTLGDGNFSFSAAVASMHDAVGKRVRGKAAKQAQANAADAAAAPHSSSVASADSIVADANVAISAPSIPAIPSSSSSSSSSFFPSRALELVASSFDSRAEIRAKYPESGKLIEKVIGAGATAKRGAGEDAPTQPRRAVLHDVDATNLARTLLPQLLEDGGDSSSTSVEFRGTAVAAAPTAAVSDVVVPSSLQFDVIVFNHPHSGKEDLPLHSSLLAHFFHSARPFLRSSGVAVPSPSATVASPAAASVSTAPQTTVARPAQVHVTLCQRQPEEWSLLSRASAAGFRLLSRSEFLEAHYPGYETKRHHVNKTFAKRSVQRMELFVFEITGVPQSAEERAAAERPVFTQTEQDPTFSHNLLSLVVPLPTFKPTLPYEQAIAAIAAASMSASPSPEAAASSFPAEVNVVASTAAVPLSLHTQHLCSLCRKGFASERALRGHMSNAHPSSTGAGAAMAAMEDGDGGSVATAASAVELTCDQCEPRRAFKGQTALEQHVLARHSDASVASAAASSSSSASATAAPSSAPSIAAAVSTDSRVSDGEFECRICGFRFATALQLSDHVLGVRPIVATQVECMTCGRFFSNQRALEQHERAANLTPETHVRIVLAAADAGVVVPGSVPAAPSSASAASAPVPVAGRSKMKKLRGMVSKPAADSTERGRKQQSVVQRLQVQKVDAPSSNAGSAGSASSAAAASCAAASAAWSAAESRATVLHPVPGLDDELAGSERDLVGTADLVHVVHAGPDLRLAGPEAPHTVQAVFAVRFKEPPQADEAAEDEAERNKLASASRTVYAAACLPAGYALLHGPPIATPAAAGGADADVAAIPRPLVASFASPLCLHDSLDHLLLAASPIYAAHKTRELNDKLMQLFLVQQQQDEDGNADDAGSEEAAQAQQS